jgi:eukaryotic-like serine/threonine-protein kinase
MTPEHWRQIEDLYNLACERGEGVLAGADPELRREVQELLAQKSAGNIFDQPVFNPADSTMTQVAVGSRMGPYRIESLLGQGGMGDVFRATDTRLGREVAVKISQERFTDRFEREARAIAAVNHPNICTLHDVGPNYLVMELVQGETLAARLKRGKLSTEQAIQYGAQIASALSAAHAKGIVHRDLKPGNIMITKTGVKVLDFGLAKSAQDETLTVANAVMGTPAYMAPEQREGNACDARTDIYALGLVLAEMATGTRPKAGERTQVDSLPEKLAHVIDRCVALDPEDRWQSARDLKSELEWATRVDTERPGPPSSAGWRRTLPWALFGVATIGLAVFAWLEAAGPKNAVRAEPMRFQIPMPQKSLLQLTTGSIALSPDGRQLAFIASGADGTPRIYLRAMDSLEIRPLAGTEAVGSLLIWKPDGRSIAFDSGGKLRKADISGGPAEVVCALNLTGVGGSWNAGGDIIFGQFGGPIMRVSAAGGDATPITVVDKSHGDVAHTEPQFLPDGRHFIYTRDLSMDIAISVGSLDVKPEAQASGRLVQTSRGGAYAPSSEPGVGELLFLRGQTLMAQPFDVRRFNMTGDPVRVVEDPVAELWDTGAFSASENGTLVYWSPGDVETRLTWFDAQGNVQSRVGSPAPYVNLALSPDGTRAVTFRTEAGLNLFPWMVDLSRGTSARYELGGPAGDESAVWAPDGRSIIFSSANAGQMADIFEKRVDGAAGAEALVKSNEWKLPLSWSPDARFLLYLSIGGETTDKLWVLPLQGDRKPWPLIGSGFDESDARFSPAGRWVAYVSNESGRYEVYVRPFAPEALLQGTANVGAKWLISDKGGSSPMWRQDGKELYYIDLEGNLNAVTISAGAAFQAGVPKVLFRAPQGRVQKPGMTRWSPSPDGKRFLFLVPEKQDAAPLTVLLNWQAGLKK